MEIIPTGRTAKRTLLLVLCSAAATAFANEYAFSIAATPVVGLSFLAWIVVGLVVKLFCRDLMYFGLAAVLTAALFTFYGHPEGLFPIWMIYLALVVLYFAFRHKTLPRRAVRVNVAFHGTFLAIVIVGGIVSKIFFWSQKGGYAAWSAYMRDQYPAFLIWTAILSVFVAAAVRSGVASRFVRSDTDPDDRQ